MHTLTLHRYADRWHAHSTHPEHAAIFGTDELPTTFLADTPPRVVLREIARLNPSFEVFLAEAEADALNQEAMLVFA